MPKRAPSVCGYCGHTHLTGEKCSYIAALDKERKARFDKKRPNSSQRGYNKEWEREAKAFLSQPQNKFCECGAKATLVRHKISIRQRPDLRMVKSNWMAGCQRCNAIDAVKERRNQRKA